MPFNIDFKAVFGSAVDMMFGMGLQNPDAFLNAARPILMEQADGDIVRANALALEGLETYLHIVKRHSGKFLREYKHDLSYDSILTTVAGRQTTPVGTACGMDPNADGLEAFSYLFGFQTPGPVTVRPRVMPAVPFQDAGSPADLFVSPLLPNEGLDYFLHNVKTYRERGGDSVILAAVVGLTDSSSGVDHAFEEMRQLLESLEAYVDGFVWIPQMAGDRSLMSPREFGRTASLMSSVAGRKLKLVELLGCEEAERVEWLSLVETFCSSGGDGLVAVGGLEVPRSRVPQPDQWPFETAVLCGASIQPYRQWAVEQVRRLCPDVFIVACGGFHTDCEAFTACQFANVIMENEAFTRYGPGIACKLLARLVLRLRALQREGTIQSDRLVDYQQARWNVLSRDIPQSA